MVKCKISAGTVEGIKPLSSVRIPAKKPADIYLGFFAGFTGMIFSHFSIAICFLNKNLREIINVCEIMNSSKCSALSQRPYMPCTLAKVLGLNPNRVIWLRIFFKLRKV